MKKLQFKEKGKKRFYNFSTSRMVNKSLLKQVRKDFPNRIFKIK